MVDVGEQLVAGDAAVFSRLLDSALELPVSERLRWVDALDPQFSSVKLRLRSLVARSCDPALSTLLHTLPKLPPRDDVACVRSAGERFHNYHLVQRLGMGAMGEVWLAQDELGARVALKLARGGRDSALQAHLHRERELLALLDHPNIVRLLGHDHLDDGTPFLVLEYVSGKSLQFQSSTCKLALAQRLELFAQLVAAVGHAHARGVVHRDLKPANIIVSPLGRVRLLDFGIGVRLADRGGDAGNVELTPAYASPEQLVAAEVCTASDVYSLGVIVYELLTGQRPHGGTRTSLRELRELVSSARVVAPSEICGRHGFDVRLWAELDELVLTALDKSPERRYASALELGAALAPIRLKLPALR